MNFNKQKLDSPVNTKLNVPHSLDWNNRPSELKLKIENAWKAVSYDPPLWFYNGEYGEYALCRIQEYELLKQIIRENPNRKEFYALDIGAGMFEWGRRLAQQLNDDQEISKEIIIHIIGIRGELNREQEIIERGITRIYNFGYFKIENLIEEFHKRNLNLEKKVDLIVSQWTFRHLADPLGTFVQAYNLLSRAGFLLMDGFFYMRAEIPGKIDDKKWLEYHYMNTNLYWLLLQTKSPFLVYFYNVGRSLDQCILKKIDEKECQLPLSYAGMYKHNFFGYQIASNTVTIFNQTMPINFKIEYGAYTPDKISGNQELFNYFLSNNLFHQDEWCCIQYGGPLIKEIPAEINKSVTSINKSQLAKTINFFSNGSRFLLFSNSLFKKYHSAFLEENRHGNAIIQHEYDKKYGLVCFNR